MSIIETFDDITEEILKPSHVAKKIEGFPEIVIVTFGRKMLDILIENNVTEIISTVQAGCEIPIYKTKYKNREIAFFKTLIGGPATVGILEEIIIKGGRKILLFGSSGSLDKNITDGHIIIPNYAYRDEGTSYHYVSASTGDFIEIKTAKQLTKIFADIGIPAIMGKTWTTDAIYRETQKNKELRKQNGCLTVEMECASVMAMGEFRKIDIYQFLYTADNLDCKEWESRLLGNMPQSIKEKYVQIALEVSIRL
jgi:uridine phosphorylase